MNPRSGRKTLSFVVTGRNDDYCGNFLHRLGLSMNYLAWNAGRAGLLHDLELLLVDWNSDTPLSDALALRREALGITRFVRVPPALARQHHDRPGQAFNPALAANAGIRQASGRFVFYMPADAIVSQAALHNLHQLLSGRYPLRHGLDQCIFKVARKMIPQQISSDDSIDVEALDAYLVDCSSTLYMGSNARITAGLASIGASREVWRASRGFAEAGGGWGFSDTDFGLRVEQIYQGLELSHYGILFYDLEQAPELYHRHTRPHANAHRYSDRIVVNGEDWGLAGVEGITKSTSEAAGTKPPPEAGPRPWPVLDRLPEIDAAGLEDTQDPERGELARIIHGALADRHPGLVMEFQIARFSAATFLAAIDNTLDLVFFSPWHLAVQDGLTPAELGRRLRDLRHRGRCGFFVGETADTVARYREKTGRRSGLLIVHTDPLPGQRQAAAEQLQSALSLLDQRGRLLLLGRAESHFLAAVQAAQPIAGPLSTHRIGPIRLATCRVPTAADRNAIG
jgi:hypothetical protein